MADSEIVDGDATVHHERRARDPSGLVARQEDPRVHYVLRRAEAAEGDAIQTLVALRLAGPERAQQRRLDGAGADGVGAHAPSAILHRQRARQRYDGAFARRIGILRHRAANERYERRDVDHRTAARLQQLWDAVLAAEEDALEVHVQHALIGLLAGLLHRGV